MDARVATLEIVESKLDFSQLVTKRVMFEDGALRETILENFSKIILEKKLKINF